MLWYWSWLSMAVLMGALLFTAKADAVTVVLCFVAWCGGVVSDRVIQKLNARKLRKRTHRFH